MKLQLYVLRQLLASFSIAVAGIAFLVFPAVTVSAVHRLGGASLPVLLPFIPMLGVELVPFLLPMAFLLSVVAVFGRLAADNEWTSIRMAGIDPARLLVPALGLAALLSLGTGWIVHEVAPDWKFQQRAYGRHATTLAFRSLIQARTEINIGDFYMNAASIDPGTTTFRRVLVYLPHGQGGGDRKIAADTATFAIDEREVVIAFQNARVVKGSEDFQNERPIVRFAIDELVNKPDKERNAPKFWRTSELLASDVTFTPDKAPEFAFEPHRRNALSVTYLLFVLLGVPTGVWLRRGSQLAAFATAVGYAFLYYVLSLRVGKELSYVGALPAWAGAWAVNAVGAALGVWLTWRAVRR